ncbi:MAG: hypothetical protein BWK78_06680 [Thiotrichaceae bacterium IS1]|nr:MAG: hypothetical protein BWK78_06680 [Thiotrichaceae bacterium IS1]
MYQNVMVSHFMRRLALFALLFLWGLLRGAFAETVGNAGVEVNFPTVSDQEIVGNAPGLDITFSATSENGVDIIQLVMGEKAVELSRRQGAVEFDAIQGTAAVSVEDAAALRLLQDYLEQYRGTYALGDSVLDSLSAVAVLAVEPSLGDGGPGSGESSGSGSAQGTSLDSSDPSDSSSVGEGEETVDGAESFLFEGDESVGASEGERSVRAKSKVDIRYADTTATKEKLTPKDVGNVYSGNLVKSEKDDQGNQMYKCEKPKSPSIDCGLGKKSCTLNNSVTLCAKPIADEGYVVRGWEGCTPLDKYNKEGKGTTEELKKLGPTYPFCKVSGITDVTAIFQGTGPYRKVVSKSGFSWARFVVKIPEEGDIYEARPEDSGHIYTGSVAPIQADAGLTHDSLDPKNNVGLENERVGWRPFIKTDKYRYAENDVEECEKEDIKKQIKCYGYFIKSGQTVVMTFSVPESNNVRLTIEGEGKNWSLKAVKVTKTKEKTENGYKLLSLVPKPYTVTKPIVITAKAPGLKSNGNGNQLKRMVTIAQNNPENLSNGSFIRGVKWEKSKIGKSKNDLETWSKDKDKTKTGYRYPDETRVDISGSVETETTTICLYPEGAKKCEFDQLSVDAKQVNITSSPQGINCGGGKTNTKCTQSFIRGSKVILTAKPPSSATGCKFEKWSAENDTKTGKDVCSEETNGKTPTCTVDIKQGMPSNIYAVFSDGKRGEIRKGTRDADSCEETSLLSIIVNPDKVGNIVNMGGGSITEMINLNCETDCSQDFPINTNAVLTAKAAAGYTFTGWTGKDSTGNDICPDTKNTACTVSMNTAKAVTATFAQNVVTTYPLTLTVVGANGKVTSSPVGITDCAETTCKANFAAKANVTLTATPTSGYEVSWTGCTPTTKTTCMVNMATAAKTVTATFIIIPPPPTYSVSPESTTNGSSTWGTSYFTLHGVVEGNDLRLTVSKTDGTNFTTSGLMYFRVGSYNSAENRCTGGMPVIVDSKFKTCTHDLSLYTGYPKDFYVYFDSDQPDNNGNRTFTWVGPVTVTQHTE